MALAPPDMHAQARGGHGLSTVDDQTNGPLEPPVTLAADWIPAAKQWLRITLGKGAAQ